MYSSQGEAPPPAYSAHPNAKMDTPYQQQGAPYVSAAPPFPGYAQPVMALSLLGRAPVAIQCPRCQQQIVSVVQFENGSGTWLIALLICLFGGIFGCCLIPFCVPGCQDAVHTCPSCHGLIGRRNVF